MRYTWVQSGECAPLFKSILTPAGRESIPALIASKACSYGTGFAVHVSIMRPCCWVIRTVFGDVEDGTDSYLANKDMIRANLDCSCTLLGALLVEKDEEEGETHCS
jgi:hypothetical protein